MEKFHKKYQIPKFPNSQSHVRDIEFPADFAKFFEYLIDSQIASWITYHLRLGAWWQKWHKTLNRNAIPTRQLVNKSELWIFIVSSSIHLRATRTFLELDTETFRAERNRINCGIVRTRDVEINDGMQTNCQGKVCEALRNGLASREIQNPFRTSNCEPPRGLPFQGKLAYTRSARQLEVLARFWSVQNRENAITVETKVASDYISFAPRTWWR